MSTTIPEDMLYQWSISGDTSILVAAQDYIRDDFETGRTNNIECWRGGSTAQHTKAYKIGDILDYGRSSSWTLAKYVAEMFADIAVDNYGGEKIIYHLKYANMLDVSSSFKMQEEGEFLSHPDSKFIVLSVDYDEYDGYFVELEEVF